MNTICSQCGSVLASGVHACNFCESADTLPVREDTSQTASKLPDNKATRGEWRGELNQRLQAYRARRRKTSSNEWQSALPFEDERPGRDSNVALREPTREAQPRTDDFAFTIAIGRVVPTGPTDSQVLIDVSTPPSVESGETDNAPKQALPVPRGFLPVASLDERRHALLIDAACLAFAYGSFLALFGSLGGHFTLSKLNAAVYIFTFAFVYLQYFGLFTIFGGSTPGMMLSGLQVGSVTGDVPTARQYLLRAAGYMLSMGTCFLGFLWVLWDEEGLTWHDRISDTYLTNVESFEEDTSHAAPAR